MHWKCQSLHNAEYGRYCYKEEQFVACDNDTSDNDAQFLSSTTTSIASQLGRYCLVRNVSVWKSTARQNKPHAIHCRKHLKMSEQNVRDNINSNKPEQSKDYTMSRYILHYVQTDTKQQTKHMQSQKDQEMNMVIPVH